MVSDDNVIRLNLNTSEETTLFGTDELEAPYKPLLIRDDAANVSVNNINNGTYSVFPNPTKGIVNFTEPANYQLINQTGQLVMEGKDAKSIQLSSLPGSIYILTLTNKEGEIVYRDKIIVE